jgi:hypothetical protein
MTFVILNKPKRRRKMKIMSGTFLGCMSYVWLILAMVLKNGFKVLFTKFSANFIGKEGKIFCQKIDSL